MTAEFVSCEKTGMITIEAQAAALREACQAVVADRAFYISMCRIALDTSRDLLAQLAAMRADLEMLAQAVHDDNCDNTKDWQGHENCCCPPPGSLKGKL